MRVITGITGGDRKIVATVRPRRARLWCGSRLSCGFTIPDAWGVLRFDRRRAMLGGTSRLGDLCLFTFNYYFRRSRSAFRLPATCAG
ncbi:MAG: hypothetical protein ABI868_13990 [Acidobacteriota bacterium]